MRAHDDPPGEGGDAAETPRGPARPRARERLGRGERARDRGGGVPGDRDLERGHRISRAEMLDMVRRIAAAVPVPVTADVEGGYGETRESAAETARAVLAAGAVGMNLEDAR